MNNNTKEYLEELRIKEKLKEEIKDLEKQIINLEKQIINKTIGNVNKNKIKYLLNKLKEEKSIKSKELNKII